MNDNDRIRIVRHNDELRRLWVESMGGERCIREFVRSNRRFIDNHVQDRDQNDDKYGPYYMLGRGGTGPSQGVR